METLHILFSGDFWHEDFRALLSGINVPATFVPLDALDTFDESGAPFGLVVLAQSTRDRVRNSHVETVRDRFPGVRIVNLLGSWCEGETRSGVPLEGVVRIYWHQWQGRFQSFLRQLNSKGITEWHLPQTAGAVDRVDHRCKASTGIDVRSRGMIGISAWSSEDYEMLKDAVETAGWRAKWIERNRWDSTSVGLLQAICVEGRCTSTELDNRLQWLQANFHGVPAVLVLNFPRLNEVPAEGASNVRAVVSKPFELEDLESAIERVCDAKNPRSAGAVPPAHFSGSERGLDPSESVTGEMSE